MMRLTFMAGLLALAVCIPPARAGDDDIRLRLPATPDDFAPARTLGADADDLDADTIQTRHYGFRGGFVGYRGGVWGGHRGWGWGGHRGWGWAGHRGWGWGGFHPVYRGFHGGYFGPRYVGGLYTYYPSFYSSPVYYSYPVYSTYYYSPCALVTAAPTTTLQYRIVPSTPAPAPSTPTPADPAPPMPNADGTYPYNGGPAAPVPMPRGGDEAMTLPRVPTPVVDRWVSLKAEPVTGKYIYPAYGETPRRSGR